jgi:hypothetical protein
MTLANKQEVLSSRIAGWLVIRNEMVLDCLIKDEQGSQLPNRGVPALEFERKKKKTEIKTLAIVQQASNNA